MTGIARQRIKSAALGLGLLGGFLLASFPATAAVLLDSTSSAARANPEYPGIEQLDSMSSLLGGEAAEATKLLDKWSNLDAVSGQVEDQQQVLTNLDQRLNGWGPVAQWSEGRLLGARQRLIAVRDRQNAQLKQLVEPIGLLEENRRLWADKETFWDNWQIKLKRDRSRSVDEIFRKNRSVIGMVLDRMTTTSRSLSELQQKILSQQEVVSAWIGQIDGALAGLHGPLLERNAEPLLSSEFFDKFNASLWTGLSDDFSNALAVPSDFAPRHGWSALLQLFFALAIAWQLHRRSRRPEPVTGPWQFLFRHPLAGATFITLLAGTLLYSTSPPLWKWAQTVLGTLSATVLICAMLERPRLRRVIIILAGLFVVATTFRLIGLVQPLHRLYLAGVCVIAAPICLSAARRQMLRNEGRFDLLAGIFYLGTLAASVGLLAQAAGFASLAALLVDAFLGSTFVFLFARMALHLGDGAISALLDNEGVRSRLFIQRLGPRAGARLSQLMRVVVTAYATLYLLVQWRIYPTPGDAWDGIRMLTMKLGELQISLETLLMTGFVIYLSLFASWVIQSLIDAEVMTPRGTEPGVVFAVRTLVHYSMVLAGLLVAVSVAGIDMSKFAILAGALGVGIGFGLQNIVNNFISGLILLFERPIKIGDTVSVDNEWGTITAIGLRSTVIETLDRSEVIVPNSELISQKVTNWTLSSNVSRIVLPVGVAYGTPLDEVLSILTEIAKKHPEVLDSPPPSAIFKDFGESSIDFELRVWISDIQQRLKVRSDLGLAIDQHFRAAGIVIPFPQRDLHLHGITPNLQDTVALAPGSTRTTKDPFA